MRTNITLAALLLVATAFTQAPVSAEKPGDAVLQLRIVDQTRAVLPSATVTIYTLDGNPARTVTADANGVATFADLTPGVAQIHAKFPGLAPYIEGTKLKSGKNEQTVMLKLAPVTESLLVTPGSAVSGS
jgi:hypothetical protein